MLAKECVELLINQLKNLKYENNGKAHIGDALDWLIDDGGYNVIDIANIEDIETKFSEFVTYYIVRHLGRDIDFFSDDRKVIKEEIDKYWSRIATSKSFMNYG